MVSSHWTAITAATLSAVMCREQIGDVPLLVRPEPAWIDTDRRRSADMAAQAEIARLGWIDRYGRLEGAVLDQLHLLAHASLEYGAVFEIGGRQRRVAVVGAGNDGVLIRRDGPMINFSILQDELLPEILLGQLPHVPPAALPAANLRRADINADETSSQDRRALRAFRDQELRGAGELYVGVRDRFGHQLISPPVRYQDYPIGRILVVLSDGYLSIAPASRRLLLDRLHEARAAIAI